MPSIRPAALLSTSRRNIRLRNPLPCLRQPCVKRFIVTLNSSHARSTAKLASTWSWKNDQHTSRGRVAGISRRYSSFTHVPSTSSSSVSSSSNDGIQYDRAFLDQIRKRLGEIPNTSPYFRQCQQEPVRQAGVFVPLCIHKGVPSVLFTVRAKHMRNHRGEISFPGGKRDPTDTTILDTALREMGEEISIFQDQVEVLGEYLPMPNKDCTLRVHSFVGIIKEPIEDIGTIAYNPDEVQRVFTVSMQDLMDPQKKSMVRFRNSKYLYPIWNIEEENISIWGLTAFILNGVLRQIEKEGPANAVELPKDSETESYRPPKPSA